MIPPLTFMVSNKVHENRQRTRAARHYALHYVFVFVPLLCSSLSSFGDVYKPGASGAQLETDAQQAVSARDFAKAADLYDQAAHTFGEQRDLIKQADCLVESGRLRIELQQYEEAYQRFLQSSELYNKAPDALRSSITLNKYQKGIALYYLKGPEEALEELQEVLEQLREQGGLQRETAICLQFLAAIMNEQQHYEDALTYAKEGAQTAIQAGAVIEQADCTLQQVTALVALGRHEEALAACEQARGLYAKLENTEQVQANLLLQMGNMLYGLGKAEEALAQFDKALSLPAEVDGVNPVQALCRMNIGVALNDLGRHEEAFKQCQTALNIFRAIEGAEINQGQCLLNLGIAVLKLGRSEEAIQHFEEAETVLKGFKGTESWQALCSMNIGATFNDLGRYEEAFKQCQTALIAYKAIEGAEMYQGQCLLNLGYATMGLERYEEALQHFTEAELLLNGYGGTESWQALCSMNIGATLLLMEKYEEGLEFSREGLGKFRRLEGSEDNQAKCLVSMASAFNKLGRYEEALSAYEQLNGLYAQAENTEQKQVYCLQKMGELLYGLGKIKEALDQYEKALSLPIKGDEVSPVKALCFMNAGVALNDLGRHEEAYKKCQAALAMFKAIEGAEINQGQCLLNLGNAVCKQKQYEEALQHYKDAKALLKDSEGAETWQALCNMNIGGTLLMMDFYEESLHSSQEGLDQFILLEGSDINQAKCFANSAAALNQLGKYEEALEASEKAQAILQITGVSSYDATLLSYNMGQALLGLGRFADAQDKYEKSLEYFRAIPNTQKEQSLCIFGIGSICHGLGKFYEALAFFQEASASLVSLENTKKEQGLCALSMGITLSSLARSEEALKALDQAREVFDNQEGRERERAAVNMHSGFVLMDMERYEESLLRLQEAHELFSTQKDSEWAQALSLAAISLVLSILERPEEAYSSLKQAESLYAAKDGGARERALYLLYSGLVLQSLGRFQEALSAHKETEDLSESTYMGDLALSFNHMLEGRAYGALNDWPNALKYGYKGRHGMWTTIIPNLPALTEGQKHAVLAKYLSHSDYVYGVSLLQGKAVPDSGRYGLDTLLLSKGLVEYAMQQEQAVFAEKAPLEWQQEYDELQQWRREKATQVHTLNDVMHNPNVKDSPEAQEARINWAKELETMIVTREQDLAQRNTAFAAEMRLQVIDSNMVSEALVRLGTDTALLEYVKYEDWDFIEDTAKETRYGAYVLLADTNMPVGVDLGPATPIDEAVNKFRFAVEQLPSYIGRNGALPDSEIMKEMTTECIAAGNLLRELVFDPMLTHISGCRRLFVAPDAELFLFPFEALPSPEQQQTESRFLVEDYELVYLNTGRELVRFTERHTTSQGNNTAVLVSDPALRMAPTDRAIKTTQWLEANARDTQPATVAGGQTLSDAISEPFLQHTTLGAPNEDKSLGQILETLQQIKGAATFSENVLDSLRQSGKYDVVNLYEQEEALEVRVQSLESPRVLQVLAHGIFLPVEEEKEAGPASMFIEGISHGNVQNPLLRSMLALAGASISTAGDIYRMGNRFLTQDEWSALEPDEREVNCEIVPLDDGRLTAYEVTGMRLHDTELVALTACNTALGDVGAGASVAGLRRAFITAGAHSMIMAQWEVPERSSLSQMQYFYDTWLDDDKGRYTAFRESQLKMLDSARTDVLGNPWFWAGFVYIGDPGESVDSAIME
jgi:tetratricopeptide (TPR) repeat protein/CHAT domain-containing protein